jgi:hypothetical protein
MTNSVSSIDDEVSAWSNKNGLAIWGLLLVAVGLWLILNYAPFLARPVSGAIEEDRAALTAPEATAAVQVAATPDASALPTEQMTTPAAADTPETAEEGTPSADATYGAEEEAYDSDATRSPAQKFRYWAGWICVLLGLVTLLQADCTIWPELILAVVIVLVVVGLPALPIGDEADKRAKVPIPSSKFAGGIDFLWPRQVVGLVAYVPNATGTPEAQVETHGEVMEARGKENRVVLMAVPTESAQALQEALLAENANLTYQLLTATPVPTPKPSPTEAPEPPGPTDRTADKGYMEIEATKINPRASTLTDGSSQARLVIVEKREEAPAGKPDAVTITYKEESVCVTVEAFLDANGHRQEGYDPDKTTHVLISFETDKLAKLARSLAAAEHIWMVNEENCSD